MLMDPTERRQILAGWTREFGLLLLVYLIAYAAAMWAMRSLPNGSMRFALIVVPVLPGLLLIASAVRSYRRCDEFIRLRILQATAVTAVVTAVWTLAYGYLEIAGLPHLNVAVTHAVAWPIFVWQMARLLRMGS
jgi:hypothetical protein